jgi:uncharacterized membrane protein
MLPTVQAQQTVVWQGQYPPPEAVERYEKILPGAFDRMIRMAEQLQSAQIEEAKRALDYTQRDTKRGHWLGWSSGLVAIVGALCCLLLQYPWVASVFLGVPVLAVARALIESARSQPTGTNVIGTNVGPTPAPGPPPTEAK